MESVRCSPTETEEGRLRRQMRYPSAPRDHANNQQVSTARPSATPTEPIISTGIDRESDIVLIPSTQGKFFMVDAEDEERVRQFKWCANRIGHGWYAVTWNSGKHTLLHRFIMDAPKGMLVDHINGDTLNCCKWNMRIVTRLQNNLNRVKKTTSVYKGVSRKNGQWLARVQIKGRYRDLGLFGTPEEAARAYDAAARELHGEFARLNFEVR